MWVLKVLWRTLLQKNIAFWWSVDIALHNLPAHDGLIAYILISAENILHLMKLGCCKICNKKCAFKEHTLTRDQICLVYKNNFPLKIPKIYLSSCLHNYSLSCRRFVSLHKPILYYCIFMKFVNTQNDLKLCSCRVSDLTHVFISANQMKIFSSFLFCFPYSTLSS